MSSKDYYQILGIKPTASADEIKRNYRRLALKYHPDRNPGDPLAESVFKEIAEAYEILSDPVKRQDYHYKRLYTYNYKFREAPAATPQSVLKDCTKLNSIIASSDPFRINRDAIYFSLEQILSESNLYLLKQEENKQSNKKITEVVLYCSRILNFKQQLQICKKLQTISNEKDNLELIIREFLDQQKKLHNWNRYKPLVAIICAVILCFVIYFLSK